MPSVVAKPFYHEHRAEWTLHYIEVQKGLYGTSNEQEAFEKKWWKIGMKEAGKGVKLDNVGGY